MCTAVVVDAVRFTQMHLMGMAYEQTDCLPYLRHGHAGAFGFNSCTNCQTHMASKTDAQRLFLQLA